MRGDSPHAVSGGGIGAPVKRREDLRLVRGNGYSDDVNHGQCYAIMVRSPYAHAQITGIDIKKALATSGVIAVLTGADVLADGPAAPAQHLRHCWQWRCGCSNRAIASGMDITPGTAAVSPAQDLAAGSRRTARVSSARMSRW